MADTAAHARPGLRGRYGLAAVAGVAAGLGQVPFSLEVLGLMGLAGGFMLAATADNPRAAFKIGWAFGTAYFALTLHWIVEPFFVDVARHGWMAPFAIVLLSGGLALFWGAATALARWLGSGLPAFALAWPVAMAGAEMLRGYVFTGFPWALPSYLWIETPAAFLARLTGPYGLTFLTFALAGLTGLALSRSVPRSTMIAPLAAAALLVGGGAALRPTVVPPGPDAPIVRLIQPNAPQHEKWDPERIPVFFRRQLEFTAAPAERAPDLILWSESSIPWMLGNAEPAFEQMSRAAGPAQIVVGLQRRDGLLAYNSLAALDGTGRVTDVYDKHHLVPFGEYVPLGNLMGRLGITGIASRTGFGYSAGPGPQIIDLGPLGRALPLICYEAIFPHNITAASERPDWLMHLTNDAWFGEIAGPYQHLAKARARAIETGLPLLRSANTGVSAAIDPAGDVIASLPLNEAGYLDVALPPPGAPTLYSQMGDRPWAIAFFAALAAFGIARRRFGIDRGAPRA
ncbi:MAG: apolipoprotein N-acyltransferase [Pseudomonadota bacterium]